MRRHESHITKRVMSMNVDGHPRRGRPKKRWMDCVKDDMGIKGVSKMTWNRRKWKKKTCSTDPT
jgi:tRNA U34 5-methylaminomethyl-2-thiouridine-forming methyltransferase MnmC